MSRTPLVLALFLAGCGATVLTDAPGRNIPDVPEDQEHDDPDELVGAPDYVGTWAFEFSVLDGPGVPPVVFDYPLEFPDYFQNSRFEVDEAEASLVHTQVYTDGEVEEVVVGPRPWELGEDDRILIHDVYARLSCGHPEDGDTDRLLCRQLLTVEGNLSFSARRQ